MDRIQYCGYWAARTKCNGVSILSSLPIRGAVYIYMYTMQHAGQIAPHATRRASLSNAISADLIGSLLRELAAAGLRTASASEPGWYWTASDGGRHWVTSIEGR